MGDWTIIIEGSGVHHNRNLPNDANRMTSRFVKQLKEAGHTIKKGTFVLGYPEDVTKPEYEDNYTDNKGE